MPPPDHCSHQPTCPGCPRFGSVEVAAKPFSILSNLAGDTGAALEQPILGPRVRFRSRARLAIRGRARNPKIGIFQEGSHQIADIPHCPIQHTLINEIVADLKAAIRSTGLAPYADNPHLGLLRYVQIVVDRPTQKALVSLVTNSASPAPASPLFPELIARSGTKLLGLWWNGNPDRGNAILGPHWEHISGATQTNEDIGGASVGFPPWAFGQSNLDLADQIVGLVHEELRDAKIVAEFHAGVGAIGLGLLRRGVQLRANEIADNALHAMRASAENMNVENRLHTIAGVAGDAKELLANADAAIVDPPRKGLDPGLIANLIKEPPSTLIYVACGTAALDRDLRQLVDSGVWSVTSLHPFDLFPHTEHLETVAILRRR